MRRLRPRRLVPLAAGTALVLAACGGGGDGGDDAVEVLPPAAEAGTDTDADTGSAAVDPSQLLPTQVDLIGEAVQPSSEIESNLLPAVVLDDLTTGRKVNFRNLVPQDKPILLWMYAPH